MRWLTNLLELAVLLVKPSKRLADEIYEAKYGMSHEEALRRKARIDSKHVPRRK